MKNNKFFIKPIPKEANVGCSVQNCRNKGQWNIQNGRMIYCDKHFLNLIKKNEGEYLIINKSLKLMKK
jgi:hypothetical protein